jgi:hypothetical protein
MSQLLPSVEVSTAAWRPAGILGVTPCGQLALGPQFSKPIVEGFLDCDSD